MNRLAQSIFNKVMALLVTGSILSVGAAWFYHHYTSQSVANYQQLLDGDVLHVKQTLELKIILQEQLQNWKSLLFSKGNKSLINKYWGEFQDKGKRFQELGKKFQQSLVDESRQKDVQRLLDTHQKMLKRFEQAYSRLEKSGFDPATGHKAAVGAETPSAQTLDTILKTFEAQVTTLSTKTTETANGMIVVSASLLFVVLCSFTLIAIYAFNNMLVSPTAKLTDIINNLSDGVLDDDIEIVRQDELGQLADAARKLQNFLRDVSLQLRDSTDNLMLASSNLTTAADTVSNNAAQEHSKTDNIASAMEQMTEAAKEVTNFAQSAAQLTQNVNLATQEGLASMKQAENSINQLSQQVNENVGNVNRLAEETVNVGAVVEVIRGIAEQTNLLALNAAIEAARAGDQGRGFAVVADEVRTLAQKTQESTEEIEVIIESVQQGAKGMVEIMDTSMQITGNSAEQFNESSAKLQQIYDSISEINNLNAKVAQSAEDQTQTSQRILKDIVGVSELTQKSSEVAASTKSDVGLLANISNKASELAHRFVSGF